MIAAGDFEVKQSITLWDRPTSFARPASRQELKKRLNDARESLADFQDRMYAQGQYSVLVCLQGMDTAGKDSLIREVFKEFNVRGIYCHSFKVPSAIERRHDYLWRHYRALPPRGAFGIFNRTHYENVLVTRVHPEYLSSENLPELNGPNGFRLPDEDFWLRRFEQIRQFERHLVQNGTLVFKFFLHISKEEQKNRLLRRLHKPEKNWKFSAGDLDERKLWDRYQKVYQEAINQTSRPEAPWFVIPSDNKNWARVIVAEILQQRLTVMDQIAYPEPDPAVKSQIDHFIEQLESDDK